MPGSSGRFFNELVEAFNAGTCPDCKAPVALMLQGPRGGININVCCPTCWAAFNVGRFQGQYVSAERIPNDWFSNQPGFMPTSRA